MHVELDIFSGRPNPGWTLSPDEAEKLTALLHDYELPAGEEPQQRLGYRGFIVYRRDAYARLKPWLRVGRGTISLLTAGGWRTYRDVVGLEDWFIELAAQEGYGPVLQNVRGKG